MKVPSILQRLARLLNCSEDRVEDALRNDAEHAKRVLGRRAFLSVGAALAVPLSESSTVYSFPELIVFDELAEWRTLQKQVRLITGEIGHYLHVVYRTCGVGAAL